MKGRASTATRRAGPRGSPWSKFLAVVLALVFVLFVMPAAVQALAPPHVYDEELVASPIIVVAQWTKKPLDAYERPKDELGPWWGIRAEIEVVRVLKGDVKPGKHLVRLGSFIGWEEKGGPVQSYTSTHLVGEAPEVAAPQLWFLERKKVPLGKDEQEMLCLETYCGVQPLVLEPYFAALQAKEPQQEVPKLLNTTDLVLMTRVLRYLTGGRSPWPYITDFEDWLLGEKKPVLAESADAVAAVFERKDAPARHLVVATYGELKGKAGLPVLRARLGDGDPEVRAVALAWLARHRDAEAAEAMERAATGVTSAWVTCQFIGELAAWKDKSAVPALITQLENDAYAGYKGDDWYVPALKAQAALHAITGHWFPFDVEAARKAWAEAGKIEEPQARQARLSQLVPFAQSPVEAEVRGQPGKAEVLLTNRAPGPLVVSREPQDLTLTTEGSICGRGGDMQPKGRDPFIRLAPGESVRFPLDFEESDFQRDPPSRKLTVAYLCLGKALGRPYWIGVVTAKFGKGWKEADLKVVSVEEKWPDGNLKAKGETRDGKPCGLWTYYNEAGDRIREQDYTKGKVAEFNPEHPSNKGLGKRSEPKEW